MFDKSAYLRSSRDGVSVKTSLSLTIESGHVLFTSIYLGEIELAEISLKSFEKSPLVHLTYLEGVSDDVTYFHHQSHIHRRGRGGVDQSCGKPLTWQANCSFWNPLLWAKTARDRLEDFLLMWISGSSISLESRQSHMLRVSF